MSTDGDYFHSRFGRNFFTASRITVKNKFKKIIVRDLYFDKEINKRFTGADRPTLRMDSKPIGPIEIDG